MIAGWLVRDRLRVELAEKLDLPARVAAHREPAAGAPHPGAQGRPIVLGRDRRLEPHEPCAQPPTPVEHRIVDLGGVEDPAVEALDAHALGVQVTTERPVVSRRRARTTTRAEPTARACSRSWRPR
jgi:hypothetical protein